MPDARSVNARRRNPLARVLAGIGRYGWRSTLSDGIFRLARNLAQGPHNAADVSHDVELRKLKTKLQKLKRDQEKAKTRVAKNDVALRKAKERIARDKQRLEALAGKAQRTAERERAWMDRLERLQEGPLFTYEVDSLETPTCVACGGRGLHVLPYPSSISPTFSRLIVLLCPSCGFGWVPSLPFDLDEYYRTEYGSGKRTRVALAPADYFAVDGTLHQPGGRLSRYFERSKQQLALIHRHKPHIETMLDFGSGPGYALFVSGATTKHAIEPDDQSIKYLDHIGAVRTHLTDLKPHSYDVILASHSVEHIFIHQLFSTLGSLRAALRDDGVLCVEVPYASLGRAYIPLGHEPHTLFFSPDALVRIIERAGFEVVERTMRSKESRRILAEPLVMPAPDPWNSGLEEGLVVLARPSKQGPIVPPIPLVATRVLRPKQEPPA
jgi:hypothetical protein